VDIIFEVNDLMNNTEYENYTSKDEVVQWFWVILAEMTDSEKADFLMFATGNSLMFVIG
jgi:hypothetical protein